MLNIQPCILTGKFIQLEPLNETHKDELYHIAQDKSIWTYNLSKAFGQDFNAWFDKAITLLASGQHYPFVVKDLRNNKIIGSTRFYDIVHEHHRLTIGYTWYVPAVWGTYVNPESKFLLLSYAFEKVLANRVEIIADSRNLHSRAAIKKLGAIEEGILRQHMVLQDGYIRDSVVHSIIKPDWENVKFGLLMRLNTK